ncbi:MAG: hypothetical protein RRY79_02540 [Clostridia bacterium]
MFLKKKIVQRDIAELENAAVDWENALECFNYATKDELIDVAVLALLASKQRYVYLLHAQSELQVKAQSFN